MSDRGRPKGSKNKPKPTQQDLAKGDTKPTIKIGKRETEHSLIRKTRGALRSHGLYLRTNEVAREVWGSKSFETKNIQLAIKAIKQFVEVVQ